MDLKNFFLTKIQELYKYSKNKNIGSHFNYKKILNNISELESITALSDLKQIKNIGSKTFIKLKRMLENKIADEYKNECDEKNSILTKYSNFIDEDFIKKIHCNSNTKVNKENISNIDILSIKEENVNLDENHHQINNFNYIPNYRTGAYAILKVLNKEDGISKRKIILRAQKYCDSEFDCTARYSAWSSMKTLLNKNLILKEKNPTKYFLTNCGKSLCDQLFTENSLILTTNEEITLIIDSREIKNKKDRNYFQRRFENLNIKLQTRNLEVGDFLWIKKSSFDEKILRYIIERKKGADFCSSLFDGRFKEQKHRLIMSGIKNIIYLVEGLKRQQMLNIGIEFALSNLSFTKYEGLIVIETENIDETVIFLESIDKELRVECINKQDKSLNAIEGEADLNLHREKYDFTLEKRSSLINYDDFADRSIKTKNVKIENILYSSLLSVNGINHEKAKFFSEKYLSFSKFMYFIAQDSFINEAKDFVVNGKKLGMKLAQNIKSLFC
ncbi:Ercc4-like endonuclease [Hamiltosporidium tvaerminnensis]|uniref:Crossover junction endonuclease MUS81 n=1 Tax=Hamiltosporidium tvaerminnensis TaxID=1176355 RepID=A0A4Q9KUS9_9MICR|nr:Ercc4-like endonuclease [Hamiltosporidium tvaerminnensis]